MRQRYASCRAVEPDAEPSLQLPHRVAHCGCSKLQPLSCGTKAQMLGHQQEGVQVREGAAALVNLIHY